MTDSDEQATESASNDDTGIRLSAIEARVLGCLIEKEATTPDAYPLTLNATVTACNQKTNREPVMKLEPGRVGQALRELERKSLVKHQYSSRAERYAHTAAKGLELTAQQVAVVGLLLLRGAQTLNELLVRTERLHRFDDAEDLAYTLERLGQKEPPVAVRLPRRSGQREDRYMHLLCGPVDAADEPPEPAAAPADDDRYSAMIERIEALEERVAELEARLDR